MNKPAFVCPLNCLNASNDACAVWIRSPMLGNLTTSSTASSSRCEFKWLRGNLHSRWFFVRSKCIKRCEIAVIKCEQAKRPENELSMQWITGCHVMSEVVSVFRQGTSKMCHFQAALSFMDAFHMRIFSLIMYSFSIIFHTSFPFSVKLWQHLVHYQRNRARNPKQNRAKQLFT